MSAILQRDALSEFTVVIMAGGAGSRLAPLTDGLPKALLPVANRPLITYVLETFERAGVKEVIVVYRQSQRGQMSQFLGSVYPNAYGHVRIDQCVVEDDVGTADALRHIKDKIKTDFIVASCDFITDVPIHHALDLHRVHDATLTTVTFRTPKLDEGKSKQKADTGIQHFIGIDPAGQRLVSYCAAVDVEEDFALRLSTLRRFPSIKLHTDLSDAHLYIFKRWVMDYVVERESISSIQGELIPLLVKAQFRHVRSIPSGPYSLSKFLPGEDDEDDLERDLVTVGARDRHPIICCVHQLPLSSTLRANTTALYLEANRTLQSTFAQDRIHRSVELQTKAMVGGDSLVAEGTKIGEHASVKRSIIGSHCSIGPNCKIINSIIMDYVTIEEGCVIESSVLSTGCKVLGQATVKESEVATKRTVAAGAKITKEKIGHDAMALD